MGLLLINANMYGGGQQPSEEEKKLREKYAHDTLIFAGVVAGALWAIPMVFHYFKKN
ncbi:hypothetical protein JA1_002573 [Spathaspora sp. JA1]|nr:hypothetical protein JA1_002573 [Spathaspora sp. JA1]